MKCWLRSRGPSSSSLPLTALARQRSALSARGLVAADRQQTLILSSGSIHMRPAAELRSYSTASPSSPPSPSSSSSTPEPPSPPLSLPASEPANESTPPAAAPEHKEGQDEPLQQQQQQPASHTPDAPPQHQQQQQPNSPSDAAPNVTGVIALVAPPVRPFRWPIFTPIKVYLMLNYLEQKDTNFKRDEFLEGAKGAFRALMEKFPPEPELMEQLREAIEPGLYKAMVDGGQSYFKNPLRVDLQLQQLDAAEIVNIHILNKSIEVEQKEAAAAAADAETFRQQPETVHVEVKFDCREQVTTKVVVENKPDQVISQDQVARSHEWVFEGTIRPGTSPLWRLVMI